jgi:hypothetical protein
MNSAHYAVIRYVPDPGRGESLNIGILLWEELSGDYRLRVDEEAIARVIRENPRLERDSLLYVEPMLREQLSSAVVPATSRIKRILEGAGGFPLDISEPRFTTIGPDDEGLDTTLDRLVDRVVHPKRRPGGGPNPLKAMDRKLAPLIQQEKVARNHFFDQTKSGLRRTADFYANSGANVALDVVRMALKKADSIKLRADAEAFKVLDVLGGGSEVNQYIVYCDFGTDQQFAETNELATRVIAGQGARVVSDPEDAVQAISDAVETTH